MRGNREKFTYEYDSTRNYQLPIVIGKQEHRKTVPPKMHFHNCNELLFVQKGNYRIFAPQMLSEGNGAVIVLFSRGVYHSVVRVDCETVPFVCNDLYFQQRTLENIPRNILNMQALLQTPVAILPLSKEDLDFIGPKMREMWQFNHPPSNGTDRVPPILYGLLVTVLNYVNDMVLKGRYLRLEGIEKVNYYITDVTKEIVKMVDSGKDISAQELAERFYVSQTKLSRDFHNAVGISMKDMISDLRLVRAKSLLKKGMDVHKVANLCGFSSTNYFIQFFRKYTGTTPGNYRNAAFRHL